MKAKAKKPKPRRLSEAQKYVKRQVYAASDIIAPLCVSQETHDAIVDVLEASIRRTLRYCQRRGAKL